MNNSLKMFMLKSIALAEAASVEDPILKSLAMDLALTLFSYEMSKKGWKNPMNDSAFSYESGLKMTRGAAALAVQAVGLSAEELLEALRWYQNAHWHWQWPDKATEMFAKSLAIFQKSKLKAECSDELVAQARVLFQKSTEEEFDGFHGKFYREAVETLKSTKK